MLSKIHVNLLEAIAVEEMCEFNGRQNLADAAADLKVTSLVRTTAVDNTSKRGCFLC